MPDESPQEIPPHHSPVRSMWAEAHRLPYTAFRNLGEARRHPEAVMIMSADYGGQILAVCPVRLIAAGEAVLQRLLCDLESITWGDGRLAQDVRPDEGSRIYYEAVPIGMGVAGGMGGGLVMDGLWLHDELAELGLDGPVEDVLRGASERITLPAIEPFRPFVSIPDARRIGGARLLFSKITTGWAGALLSCDVARIRCGEQELAELLRDLILVDRGEADDVRPRRIYDKLDVGRYRMLDGLVRAYSNSGGMMVLYVSPTGRGLHPGFRSDGLRPEVWLGRRLDRMGLMEQVCDVLDGRSPRIDVSDLPQPWAQGEA